MTETERLNRTAVCDDLERFFHENGKRLKLPSKINGAVMLAASEFAVEHANRENTYILLLLADIRSALGDPEGKMMQEDFVKHCKEVVAERDRLRERVNGLDFADWKGGAIKNRGEYGFALYDLGGCIVEHYKTPLEALTAYLKGKE